MTNLNNYFTEKQIIKIKKYINKIKFPDKFIDKKKFDDNYDLIYKYKYNPYEIDSNKKLCDFEEAVTNFLIYKEYQRNIQKDYMLYLNKLGYSFNDKNIPEIVYNFIHFKFFINH